MVEISISEECNTKSDMADCLRRIASMIEEGYTSGYYPNWEISGEEEPDIED